MTEAGWHQDSLTQRWWDGSSWSSVTRLEGMAGIPGPTVDRDGVPPPGWYPDPFTRRWWDGSAWTDRTEDLFLGTEELRQPAVTAVAAGDPSSARYQPPRRVLRLVAVAGLLVAVAGLVVVAVRGGSENAVEPQRPALTSAPQPSSTPATSGNAPTTAPATTSTPTTMSLRERQSVALATWASVVRASGAVKATDVVTVSGDPTGATVDVDSGEVSIWTADAEGLWSVTDGWTIEDWSPGMAVLEDVAMVDLTDDGSAELFVEYAPGNGFVGRIYKESAGRWRSVGFGELLRLQADGTLLGTTEICLPSCGDSFGVDYTYTWNGSTFVAQDVDQFGNPVTAFVDAICPSYRPVDYAPLRRCDKGEAVRQLQYALDSAGSLYYTDYALATDGYFGAATETSVRLYQLRNGLPVTGVADGQWYYDLIEGYNASIGDW